MKTVKSICAIAIMLIIGIGASAQTEWTFNKTIPKGWEQLNYKSSAISKGSWILSFQHPKNNKSIDIKS